jgi:hypothetical protein
LINGCDGRIQSQYTLNDGKRNNGWREKLITRAVAKQLALLAIYTLSAVIADLLCLAEQAPTSPG